MKNGKKVILSFYNSTRMAQGSLENSLDFGCETDCAVRFVSRNLVTQKNFVEFRDSRNILRISKRRV